LFVYDAPAGASGPSCLVSAPLGVPASSLSGTFPFRVSCAGFTATTTEARFDVSADGSTLEVRMQADAGTTDLGASWAVNITQVELPQVGLGDCVNGTTPALYGSQTTSSEGVCFDTGYMYAPGAPGGSVNVTPGWTGGLDVLAETQTVAVGGTPGTDLQYFTGSTYTAAACNAGFTCGTATFVTLPGDEQDAGGPAFVVSKLSAMFPGLVTGLLGLIGVLCAALAVYYVFRLFSRRGWS